MKSGYRSFKGNQLFGVLKTQVEWRGAALTYPYYAILDNWHLNFGFKLNSNKNVEDAIYEKNHSVSKRISWP